MESVSPSTSVSALNSGQSSPGIGHNNPPSPIEGLPYNALVKISQIRPLFGDPVDSTIYRWIKDGSFPAPVEKTGPNKNGPRLWWAGDIRQRLCGTWSKDQAA